MLLSGRLERSAYGNGEWMLPVATRAMQLKVFRGTKLLESEMSGLEDEEG